MLNRIKSLEFFLTLSCIGIAILPMLVYIVLSMSIFAKGVDTITKGNLIKYLHNYAELKNGSDKVKDEVVENKITITNSYESVPEYLRSKLPKKLKDGNLYRIEIATDKENGVALFCLLEKIIDGKEYFAYQNIPIKYAETFIKPEAIQTLYILAGVGIVILVFLFMFTKILIKKVTQPIYRLSAWANNLNAENINQGVPELIYPELHDIATLIQNNLSKEYDSVKKEELFWRYCSHELRTPITSISIGIELLQKKVENNIYNNQEYKNILLRLRRSSYLMSCLIETILWTGNSKRHLIYDDLLISDLIYDVLNDLKRIYYPQVIQVNIITSEYIIKAPQIAVRIVLENIIRNAFQHSGGQCIGIIQNKNTVKVFNKIMPHNGLIENIGFGLGLDLIERLTTRLGWQIKLLKDDDYNIVKVTF